MPGAALDGVELRIGHETQHLAGFEADVLHAQVAWHMVRHRPQLPLEIGFQFSFLVPQHQIFERVEYGLLDLGHVGIVGEHEWQFLLEHQHAGRHRRDNVPALVHEFGQHRDIGFLGARHGLEIAQLQFGHAATALLLGKRHGNAVVFEHGDQIFTHMGFVVVAVTGGEQGDLAMRASGRDRGCTFASAAARALAQGVAVIFRQYRLGVHAQNLVQHLAHGFGPIRGVHRLHHHRDAGQFADHVGAGQQFVALFDIAFFEFHRLGAQHQVREIYVPLMRRHIGALGHVTEIAEVAVIHDLPVVLLLHAVHFHGGRVVHQVEQRGEGIAQTHAATTAVADVEHALKLLHECGFVVKLRLAPRQGMACRRLETAFASAFGRLAHVQICMDDIFEKSSRFMPSAALMSGKHGRIKRGRKNRPRFHKPGLICRGCRGPSGTGWHVNARPWPVSRTSRRSRQNPHRARSWPCPDTCRCTRGSRRQWRP